MTLWIKTGWSKSSFFMYNRHTHTDTHTQTHTHTQTLPSSTSAISTHHPIQSRGVMKETGALPTTSCASSATACHRICGDGDLRCRPPTLCSFLPTDHKQSKSNSHRTPPDRWTPGTGSLGSPRDDVKQGEASETRSHRVERHQAPHPRHPRRARRDRSPRTPYTGSSGARAPSAKSFGCARQIPSVVANGGLVSIIQNLRQQPQQLTASNWRHNARDVAHDSVEVLRVVGEKAITHLL